MAESPNKLINAHQQVANALGKLSQLFTSDCKLTFVMRTPGRPDAFMVIGDDHDLDAVCETVQRSKTRANVTLTEPDGAA